MSDNVTGNTSGKALAFLNILISGPHTACAAGHSGLSSANTIAYVVLGLCGLGRAELYFSLSLNRESSLFETSSLSFAISH